MGRISHLRTLFPHTLKLEVVLRENYGRYFPKILALKKLVQLLNGKCLITVQKETADVKVNNSTISEKYTRVNIHTTLALKRLQQRDVAARSR